MEILTGNLRMLAIRTLGPTCQVYETLVNSFSGIKNHKPSVIASTKKKGRFIDHCLGAENMEEEVQSKEMEAGGGNPRPCLVAPVNFLKWDFFYI